MGVDPHSGVIRTLQLNSIEWHKAALIAQPSQASVGPLMDTTIQLYQTLGQSLMKAQVPDRDCLLAILHHMIDEVSKYPRFILNDWAPGEEAAWWAHEHLEETKGVLCLIAQRFRQGKVGVDQKVFDRLQASGAKLEQAVGKGDIDKVQELYHKSLCKLLQVNSADFSPAGCGVLGLEDDLLLHALEEANFARYRRNTQRDFAPEASGLAAPKPRTRRASAGRK